MRTPKISMPDLRAEVLAAPAYQERVAALYEPFRLSRHDYGSPHSLLLLQAAIAALVHGWQEKHREFRGETNLLGIAVVKRLILIIRRFLDSLVWRYTAYNRLLIQLLSEHSQTGFLDSTVFDDLDEARKITENEGAFVFVNDLTTILRYGDLTILSPDGKLGVKENKSGKGSRKSGRSKEQRRALYELDEFMRTGTRVSKDKTKDFLMVVDVPIETHHSVASHVIRQARKEGYAAKEINDCFAIEAVDLDHPDAIVLAKRSFDNLEYSISGSNLDPGTFDKPVTRIAPYGVFPFDDKDCFDLLTGYLHLRATIKFEALVQLFNQAGLGLEIPNPSKQEMDRYLTASPAETAKMRKLDRSSWFVVSDGVNSCRISPDNWARITIELMHENTFIETQKYLLRQIKAQRIPENDVTRFYIGYKDETRIWH